MRARFRRLVADCDGQNLVEYALLAGFVAIVTLVALYGVPDHPGLQTALQSSYTDWNTAIEQLACMPDPGHACP